MFPGSGVFAGNVVEVRGFDVRQVDPISGQVPYGSLVEFVLGVALDSTLRTSADPRLLHATPDPMACDHKVTWVSGRGAQARFQGPGPIHRAAAPTTLIDISARRLPHSKVMSRKILTKSDPCRSPFFEDWLTQILG